MSLDVRGKRVTVMGLGCHGGGVAAARFLARRGARVTISDSAGSAALQQSLDALAGATVERLSLGGHRESDFRDAELVVVNPAIRPGNFWLSWIESRGIPVTSEIELFLAECKANVIAVTGSNGKSTTVSMIEHILRSCGIPSHLGGNIGRSLLLDLDRISSEDWVVLELSSFQLARLCPARPIDLALLLNCTPNHLDWHGGFTDYRLAKQRLLAVQSHDGRALLNPFDSEVAGWANLVRGSAIEPVEPKQPSGWLLAGEHQRQNAACALGIARAIGCRADRAQAAINAFPPLPHRFNLIAEFAQRQFYDDSKATTPEATIAALKTLTQPVWLLAGGQAKVDSFKALGRVIAARVEGLACFGQDGDKLARATLAARRNFPCVCFESLREAFGWCWDRSAPGDALLLSPACASLDQYRDYVARAEDFASCIVALRNSAKSLADA